MISRRWLVGLVPMLGLAHSHDSVWRTWDALEPDSCAAIWLIKRYVDHKATFAFSPKGTPLTGNSFDVPDSKLRRYATESTYETILRQFRINDSAAIELGTYIHEIELNPWAVKATSPASEIEDTIRDLIAKARSEQELVTKVLRYFDNVHTELKKKLTSRDHK